MTNLSKAQTDKLITVRDATDSDAGFVYMTPKSVKLLVDAGYAECNTSMTDGDKVAVRITQSGVEWLAAPAPSDAPNQGIEPMNTEAPAFAIDDGVAIPAIKRAGTGSSTYPFADLAVGQSFFVPATEDMSNPGKSLASTVSSASKRYATQNGVRTINRRDKETGEMGTVEVPAYNYERKFMVRSVEENGAKGARVWRVAIEDGGEDNAE